MLFWKLINNKLWLVKNLKLRFGRCLNLWFKWMWLDIQTKKFVVELHVIGYPNHDSWVNLRASRAVIQYRVHVQHEKIIYHTYTNSTDNRFLILIAKAHGLSTITYPQCVLIFLIFSPHIYILEVKIPPFPKYNTFVIVGYDQWRLCLFDIYYFLKWRKKASIWIW